MPHPRHLNLPCHIHDTSIFHATSTAPQSSMPHPRHLNLPCHIHDTSNFHATSTTPQSSMPHPRHLNLPCHIHDTSIFHATSMIHTTSTPQSSTTSHPSMPYPQHLNLTPVTTYMPSHMPHPQHNDPHYRWWLLGSILLFGTCIACMVQVVRTRPTPVDITNWKEEAPILIAMATISILTGAVMYV